MIERLDDLNSLLIYYEKWFIRIHNIYIGRMRISKYQEIEKRIHWVQNPRIKVFLHVKMIKGDSFHKAVNRVFMKAHLLDPDYRNIDRE